MYASRTEWMQSCSYVVALTKLVVKDKGFTEELETHVG